MSLYKIGFKVCNALNNDRRDFSIEERAQGGLDLYFGNSKSTKINIWGSGDVLIASCRTAREEIADLWRDYGWKVYTEPADPSLDQDEIYICERCDEIVTFCTDVADYVG
tara:strand:- start:56 stop:385 length:330 start_codon:yes stop_codon:yes gene_type:complete